MWWRMGLLWKDLPSQGQWLNRRDIRTLFASSECSNSRSAYSTSCSRKCGKISYDYSLFFFYLSLMVWMLLQLIVLFFWGWNGNGCGRFSLLLQTSIVSQLLRHRANPTLLNCSQDKPSGNTFMQSFKNAHVHTHTRTKGCCWNGPDVFLSIRS